MDWSYNLRGIAEITDDAGRRYSLDPEQYDPRCRPCHRVYDGVTRVGPSQASHLFAGSGLTIINDL